MLRFFVLAGVLLGVARCAAPPATSTVTSVPAEPSLPAGQRGTILALRVVPDSTGTPVQALLRRISGTTLPPGATEFIVRTDDGSTLAVVQPTDPALRRGSRVAILRGEQTQLTPRPDVTAAR
jgi:hypothetical protein